MEPLKRLNEKIDRSIKPITRLHYDTILLVLSSGFLSSENGLLLFIE